MKLNKKYKTSKYLKSYKHKLMQRRGEESRDANRVDQTCEDGSWVTSVTNRKLFTHARLPRERVAFQIRKQTAGKDILTYKMNSL